MSLTVDQGKEMIAQFCETYPVAYKLRYRVKETQEELYGQEASKEAVGKIFGAFYPGRGQADFATASFRDADEFEDTLRHEVLGHFGINTFTAAEKRSVLNALVAARNQPGLCELWSKVDWHYAGAGDLLKAEEVYAFACEAIDPQRRIDQADGEKSLREVCSSQRRLMTLTDLINITSMVAEGMHDRTRSQQNHPLTDYEQFRRDTNMENAKKPFHETVADKLIAQLKDGTAPWQKTWQAGEFAFMPLNPTTGKRYKGINAIQLMSEGREDQRWMTYKQAAALDAQVRKNEKGTSIQYWKFSEDQTKTDTNGKPVLDAQGDPVTLSVKLERPRVFFATVFNAEQIDGLPPLAPRKEASWSAVERAEQILQASGATIRHGEQNRAFYRLMTDSIHLPDKNQFPTADNYYATALHELGHWTGHATRLDRDMVHPFGSEGYAKEELRAEISSMILGDELGIGHDPGQHAAYVASWIKALQDDPLEIFRAAADAEKIQNYVLGLEQKQIQEQAWWDEHQHQEQITPTQEANMQIPQQSTVQHQSVDRAEAWALAHVEQRTLAGVLNGANLTQLNRIQDVLRKMVPLNTQNEFWQRHELPQDIEAFNTNMNSACDLVELRQVDARVEAARLAMLPSQAKLKLKKNLITVPYKQKDEAKTLGAKWDRQEQSWYVPVGVDPAPFAKWVHGIAATAADTTQQHEMTADKTEVRNPTQERTYLAVPFGERVAAKAAGAEWDKTAKSWYAGLKADMENLERWNPENVSQQQGPAMIPREEFSDALKSLGCVVSGDHPIMDGEKHRISVVGEKFSANAGSGFYVGHVDGHPAGYIKNNKTGIDMTWKAKGYTLDPEQMALMAAEAAIKLQAREAELIKLQDQAAKRVSRQMIDLVPVTQPTTYMLAKGIEPKDGVLTDKEGKKTYIPAIDANGKQWTMQYIQEDGTKRFAKDGRKEGCFHVVGGMDALAKTPVLIIGEGYATAASLSQSLGHATVAAFDSGNLPLVAKALNEKFPDKPIIIAGDDDKHLEVTQGVNPGRSKAEEAAKVVGGKVVLPIFAPGENSYPAGLEPITPQTYREHLRTGSGLSDVQLVALSVMKQHTDFNDLVTKSTLGRDGIDRQVRSIVDSVIEKHQLKTEQHQEPVQRQEQTEKKVKRPRTAAKVA